MSNENKILQIMPADGWFAIQNSDDDESLDAVVCFALVESLANGVVTRSVRPMIWNGDEVGYADEEDSFDGVIRSDEITDGEADEFEEED
jgi:hypothetical protein